MKILFAAYRDWAINSFFNLKMLCQQRIRPSKQYTLELVQTKDAFEEKIQATKYDLIMLCGWSWFISDDLVNNNYVVCYHPSDLPDYAGGSPIQYQILDGIVKTKATLFKVTSDVDAGPILLKNDVDLSGSMENIFKSLESSSTELFWKFISKWPDVSEQQQTSSTPRKRLRPKDSELTFDMISKMSVKQLYDFIRCHEDPYPNAFLKDETGTLHFKFVEFDEVPDDS